MSVPFVRQGCWFKSDDDYYIILGVNPKDSQENIAAAYKRLARRYHPDKNTQDDRSKKEAEFIFERIKTAYDVLSDERKRQIYDTLGPEGLKLDGWRLVQKQLTAQEIRDEYLRLMKQQMDNKLDAVAKPRSSFTLALNASDLFAKTNHHNEDENEIDDELDDLGGLLGIVPSVEVSSMSASVSFDNNISTNHLVTLNGNLNSKNGTGDSSFGANYRFKYSPATQFDLLYRFGDGPVLSTGVTHRLNNRTSVSCNGLFILHWPYGIAPSAKFTLAHKIRDYLVGRVSYKDGINQSVTTSLTYIDERLMLEVTTSYKLSKLHQSTSIDFGYRFNNNDSKLSVALVASTNEGLNVEYGCETKVLEINVVGAALSFGLYAGVTLKLRYNRGNQEINVPIYLSDEAHSAPVFYGTVVPLMAYYLLDRFYLRHYKQLH